MSFQKLMSWRPLFVLRRQFRKVFGFVPTDTGRIRKLEQQSVNERLGQMALMFDLLCQEEENIYACVHRYGEALQRISSLRPRLEAARKDFWRAHKLAEIFGFKVEEHIFDHMRSSEAYYDFDQEAGGSRRAGSAA